MCIKNFTKQKTNNLFSNCRKDNLHNIHGELLKRLLIPFYVPLLVLISLFLITKSKEHKNFFSIRIVVFLIGFFTIIFSETSLQFAQDDLYENLKIIFVPFILIICLYFNFLFQFKFKHKKV
jgi:lipopolysaccharide export system permease protein